MKNLKNFIVSMVKSALKNRVVGKIVKRNFDCKIIVTCEKSEGVTLGYYDPNKHIIKICVDGFGKLIDEVALDISDPISKQIILDEVCNTIAHEFRHVEQYKKIFSCYFSRESAFRDLKAYSLRSDYDYEKDIFEIDARAYAEMYFPVGNGNAYKNGKEAEIELKNLVSKLFLDD